MSVRVGDIESKPLIFMPVHECTHRLRPWRSLQSSLFPRAFFSLRELTRICNHVNVSNLAFGRIDIHGIRIFMQ